MQLYLTSKILNYIKQSTNFQRFMINKQIGV